MRPALLALLPLLVAACGAGEPDERYGSGMVRLFPALRPVQ